ncbi:MAG: bestrophin family ion channel [Cyanobacteriota bacterium]|nr:bestrophin family ion channel [Cyanobacteriota bacterium]
MTAKRAIGNEVGQGMHIGKDNLDWLQGMLNVQKSVIPAILPRVLCCSLFGGLVAWLHILGLPVANPGLENIVPTLVLGLLLVFRTNTAYDRFWEGRKIWGKILCSSHNIAQQIWVSIEEREPEDRTQKQAILRLVIAFAISTKLYLRDESVDELKELVSPKQYAMLQSANHPPLTVVLWIRDYLNTQSKRDCLNVYQMNEIFKLLNTLVESVGATERILRTPLPAAYSIHLKQLLLIYCLILPFEIVGHLGWMTSVSTGLISFTLLGIEEIGLEIENPFGRDPNDLPLDTICQTMKCNIEDLMSLDASSSEIIGEKLE